MTGSFHTPVLFHETLHHLITDRDGTYVDGTLGGGGHAEGVCEQLAAGRLICFDADADAIRFASERLKRFTNVTFVHQNFRELRRALQDLGIGSINGLLLDLGVSSYQIDAEEKGFSFRGDERIDMRMDRRRERTGWHVVNDYEEKRLADIIWKFGEERNARRIARRISYARPVNTTGQLASAVEAAVGKQFLTKTLARVFQAIRIEVNDELESLDRALADSVEIMAPGGRIVVIAYHSLEDRIVKTFFKNESATTIPSGHKYIPDTVVSPRLRTLTRSPITATEEEVVRNPRSRSAKLRVAERIATA